MERMSSGAADEQALEEQRALALRAHLQRESPSAPPLNGGGGGQVALQIGGTSHLDDAIEPLSEHRRIEVEINSVSAHVPLLSQGSPADSTLRRTLHRLNPLAPLRRTTAAPRYRQVLFSISASARPGELLAVMGPSGSGKTSMLTILDARQQKAMRVEGSVTFNGAPLSKATRRRIGFVMQARWLEGREPWAVQQMTCLLHEALTVEETLTYAALLRLPRTMPRADKLARVEGVLRALGLRGCRATIIGGFFRKGVSGGERKRASIAVELLQEPSVLLLDEPTSGLDATTSMHLLGVLRQLAGGGRTLCATLHQPSSRLFAQLDKLLLLSQGHSLYYGSAAGAGSWFAALGYPLPFGVSLADFALDLASGEVAAPERDGEAGRRHLIEAAEAFTARHPRDGYTGRAEAAGGAGVLQEVKLGLTASSAKLSRSSGEGGSTEAPPSPASVGPAAALDGMESGKAPAPKAAASELAAGEHRWGAPWHTQVALLFRRSLRTRRFQSFSTTDILQTLAIAVLAGLFWLGTGWDDTLLGARDTLGLLFFMLMLLSFRALFNALFTFSDEYAQILLVYWMGGLRHTAAAFFAQFGLMVLAMLVAQSIGLLLGVATMAPKSAQALASVIMMLFVLTGGFFVVALPGWLAWARYLSYIYYALQISLFIQFDGGAAPVYTCRDPAAADACALASPASPETDPNCVRVDSIQQSLGLSQNLASSGEAVRNAAILLAFFAFFRVAVYIVLRRKTARM